VRPGSNGWCLLAVAVLGCSSPHEPATTSTVQEERAGAGGQIGLDLLITRDGEAVPCDAGALVATVRASRDGAAGPFTPLDGASVVVQCASGAADVAIVVDNSGSQAGKLEALRAGVSHLTASVLDAGGRASLTRVSTNAEVMAPLTDDAAALAAATDALYVNRGWTALWDGIRLGNETLGGVVEHDPTPAGDVRAFCEASRKLAIVAFTDGRDNNSGEEQASSYDLDDYPGDGFATTLTDLGKLRVDHISTPIYTIGLGDPDVIDDEGLEALAEGSGARHRRLDDLAEIEAAFADISEYFGSTHQVCADLPWSTCGDVTLEIAWTWTGDDGTVISGTKLSEVHVPCETQRGTGRQATIVVTMGNPGISRATASRLAANAVDWVSPVDAPSVLVVLDDGHHGESAGDAAYVRTLLAERGYDVTLVTERSGGLKPSDVADHDVVWFSNPGYPFDDARSVRTLLGFLADGGGVVAQGDDITTALGKGFDVATLTHLAYEHNGVTTCGQRTDNNAGATLAVTLGEGHPLLEGLEGATFGYGDDIDQSSPTGTGEVILGEARLSSGACTAVRPVVSAYAPSAP
jgi:hypothetical protein